MRVEFWGDTVEEIRWFTVADQRSLEIAEHGLWAPPCRELLLDRRRCGRGRPALAVEHPELADMLDKLAEGIAVEGMESLAPGARRRHGAARRPAARRHPRRACATPSGSAPARTTWSRTSEEFLAASWAAAAAGGSDADRPRRRPRTAALADVRDHARARRRRRGGRVTPVRAPTPSSTSSADAPVVVGARRPPRRTAATPAGRSPTCASWLRDGWRVVAGHRGPRPGRAARSSVLREADVAARLDVDLDVDARARPSCTSPRASLEHGFVARRAAGWSLLTETDLVGQRVVHQGHAPDARPRRNAVDPLQLQRRRLRRARAARRRPLRRDGAAHGRRRHPRVPRPRVRRVQARPARRPAVRARPTSSTRSPGTSAARRPRLHRLGGADWAKAKGRARKAVTRDRRRADPAVRRPAWPRPGYAFGPDTPWQRELEDAFPYVETPDQLAAIDEVKADMERPVPMDRLVCGDVGYGKTEIAVRAAFKAVQDGKQVAVLVPDDAAGAAAPLDVLRAVCAASRSTVAALSRFQTDKEAERGRRRARRRHASTSSSAPTGCSPPTCGSRTSAWSSSTRSSASASSTRSTSSALRTHGRRADDVGHADPAHAGDGGHRHPRDVDDPHPARGAAPGAHLRRRRTTTSRSPPPIRRELLREGQVFYVHNRVESIDRAAGQAPRARARGADRHRARPDERARARAGHRRLLGEGASTCWSARRSSSPASTSPTPTR